MKYITQYFKIKIPPIIQLLLKIALTVFIIGYISTLLDFKQVLDNIQKIPLNTLAMAFGLCFLTLFILTIRWCFMARGYLHDSIVQQGMHFWIANFFNLITPAAIGGDIYRIMVYRKAGREAQGTALPFGLITRERFLGLMGYCLSFLIFLMLGMGIQKTNPLPAFFKNFGMLFATAFLGLVIVQIASRPLLQLCMRFLPSRWQEQMIVFSQALCYKTPREFIILMVLTQASLFSWVAVYFVLAVPLMDVATPFENMGLVAVLSEMARWLPITIQGFGVREGVAAYGFGMMDLKAESGFLICGLAYLINTLVLILTGGIAFLMNYWGTAIKRAFQRNRAYES